MRHDHDDGVFTPLTGWMEWISRRRVKHWCRRQGLQLLRWRDAKLFEGPSTWTANEDRYRIKVLDGEGHQRKGYLVFGRRWITKPRIQVLWDEPDPAHMNGQRR